ncbi:hypothetical protein [Paenibacillus ehimensis]|nr:hypothetical protein [Paenibacillus ehimensis]
MNMRYMKRVAITAATALMVSSLPPLAPLGNQTAHADPTQVSCGPRVALINGSFEEPVYSPQNPNTVAGPGYFAAYDPNIPGWRTTASSKRYDIFNKDLMDKIQPGSVEDKQG